jgi:hypothetical protein
MNLLQVGVWQVLDSMKFDTIDICSFETKVEGVDFFFYFVSIKEKAHSLANATR